MGTETLYRGTKVGIEGGVGAVITVLPIEVGKSEKAIIESDRSSGTIICPTGDLEIIGHIESSADLRKCAGCGFFQEGGCTRYSSTRNILGARWPTRIYPLCKDEMSGEFLCPKAEQAALMLGNEVFYRGRKGIVIEDILGICPPGDVLVKFEKATRPTRLSVQELLNPAFAV